MTQQEYSRNLNYNRNVGVILKSQSQLTTNAHAILGAASAFAASSTKVTFAVFGKGQLDQLHVTKK